MSSHKNMLIYYQNDSVQDRLSQKPITENIKTHKKVATTWQLPPTFIRHFTTLYKISDIQTTASSYQHGL